MSTLEENLEEIEQKVQKLVAQNAQYKSICEELLGVRRKLEKENARLKEALASKSTEVSDLTTHTQRLHEAYQADKEGFKQRIDQYIQDIDNSIEWLKTLD